MDGVNTFSTDTSGSSNKKSSTGEILARYRPIFPKPEVTPLTGVDAGEGSSSANVLSESIMKSPYHRNVWPHLKARQTRSRKTSGPSAFSLPIPLKKVTSPIGTFPPPLPYSYHVGLFDRTPAHLNISPCGSGISMQASMGTSGINLNRGEARVPVEIDFMPKLLGHCWSERKPYVITPKPVRPVRSTIFVGCMDMVDEESSDTLEVVILKSAEEVEKDAEAEHHPVVVSDMNNKVRLANSAYKKMVGQPECSWLDCLPPFCNPCKRIGGEVVLRFLDPDTYGGSGAVALPNSFSCRVMIEWEGKNKKSVRASCDAIKLACQSKDYLFQWRFYMITKNKVPLNLPPSIASNKLS